MSDFENSRVQESAVDYLEQSREVQAESALSNGEQLQVMSPESMGGPAHDQSVSSAALYLQSQKSFQKGQPGDMQTEARQQTGAEESMVGGMAEAASLVTAAAAPGTMQPSLTATLKLKDALGSSQTQQNSNFYIQLENVGDERKNFKRFPNLVADGQDAKSEQSTESDGTQRPPQGPQIGGYGQEGPAQAVENECSRNSKNALQLINEPQLVTNPASTHISAKNSKAEISDIVIEKSRSANSNQQAHNIQRPSFGKNLELFVWGLNDNHQLGQAGQLDSARGRSRSLSPMSASCKNVLIPRQVRDVDFDVRQIVCGSCHTLILSDEGAVYGLGNNSHGQLGQPVRHQPVVSRPTKIAFAGEVAQMACSSTHSVIQTATGELYSCGLNSCGQLGLHPGVAKGQVVLDQFTQIDVQAQIDRFSCSDWATALLDTANQRVFVCGTFQMQEQANQTPMHELTLTPELENETIIDIECGNQQMLMMTKSGKVFQVDESQSITQIKSLSFVREIQAHGEYFAALTSSNRIHHWKYGHAEPFRMLELSQPSSAAPQFHALSIGEDYGHVVDQNCNLHGWGNNKNGELGTSDSYPRPKLSQIRIFNNEKQYMRCKQVFNGQSFALGLFESNVSPNGISTSPNKTSSSQRPGTFTGEHLIEAKGRDSYKRSTNAALSDVSSKYVANSTHIATQLIPPAPASATAMSQTQHIATKAQAIEDEFKGTGYKELNSSRVGISKDIGANRIEQDQHVHRRFNNANQFNSNTHSDSRQPPSYDACSALSRERRQAQYEATEVAIRKYRAQALNYKQNISRIKNNMQNSLEEETRQRHRSISPYHNVLMNLGQETSGRRGVQNYSPDIVVTKNGEGGKHMSAEQSKQLGSQSRRPSQQYSFSQLEYDFDESRHQRGQQMGERAGHEVKNHRRSDFQRSGEIKGPERYDRDLLELRGSAHRSTDQTIQLVDGSVQETERTRNLNTEYQRQRQEMNRGLITQPAPSYGFLPGSSFQEMAGAANLDQPPTVTSIEALDHRQQAYENKGGDRFSKRGRSTEDGLNMNRRDLNTNKMEAVNNLTRIIERSISATSSLIGRSQQSRSRSKREAAKHLHAPEGTGLYQRTYQKQKMEASAFRAINSASETPDGSQQQSSTTLNGNFNPNRSRGETFDISTSAICTSANPSANQSRNEMHQRISKDRSYNHNSSIYTHQANQRADTNAYGGLQPNPAAVGRPSAQGQATRPPPVENSGRVGRRPYGLASASYDATLTKPILEQRNLSTHQQIPREKLNKYKRKLKKYFAKNTEQQAQIKLLSDQVAHLERQNKRLLRADKQEESRKSKQMDALEHNLRSTEERHRRQLDQQQQEIKQLTSENIRMMAELQDRDDKHQLLDERLEFVDLEIENLGYQLKEQHELNSKLKKELTAAKQVNQEDSFDCQLQNRQEQQLQNLQQQLQEQFELNRRKDDELQRKSREIQNLKKKYGHVREQSRQLETTVKDLQAQVVGLSQANHEIGAQQEAMQLRDAEAQEEYRGSPFGERGEPPASGGQAAAQPLTFKPSLEADPYDADYLEAEPNRPHIKHRNAQYGNEQEQLEELPELTMNWKYGGPRRGQAAQVYSQDTFQQEASVQASDYRDREELDCEVTGGTIQVNNQTGVPQRALTGQSTHASQLTQPTVSTTKARHDFGHDLVLKNQKSQRVGHGAHKGSSNPSHQQSAWQNTGAPGSQNLSTLNMSQINQSSTSRLPGSARHQLPGKDARQKDGLSGPAAIYQQESRNELDQRYFEYNGCSPRDDTTFDESRVLSQDMHEHQYQNQLISYHNQEASSAMADAGVRDERAEMLQQQPVSTQMESSYGGALREALSPSYPPCIHPSTLPEEGFPNYAYVSKMYFNGQPRTSPQWPQSQLAWVDQVQMQMQHADVRCLESHSQAKHEARGGAMSPIFSLKQYDGNAEQPSLQSAGGASTFAVSAAGTVQSTMILPAEVRPQQPRHLSLPPKAGLSEHNQRHTDGHDLAGNPRAAGEYARQPRPPTHLCSQRLPTQSSSHQPGPAPGEQGPHPQLTTLPAGALLQPAASRTLSHGNSGQKHPAAPTFAELTPAQQSQVIALMRDPSRSRSRSGGQPRAQPVEHQAWAPLLPTQAATHNTLTQGPSVAQSAEMTTVMKPLSVASPDLNATAPTSAANGATHHERAEHFQEPAQIVQMQVAEADDEQPSEPSVVTAAADTSVASYKDTILSKFQRRTSNKIMDQMKARDQREPVVSRSIDTSLSRSREPQADKQKGQDAASGTQATDGESPTKRSISPRANRTATRVASVEERKSLAQARESFEHGAGDPPASALTTSFSSLAAAKKSPAPRPEDFRRQDFGELRSSERLAQLRERKAADRAQLQEYRERSRDWLKRRGRQPEQECPEAKQVASKYKEAFRNLSIELKKKISTTAKSPYSSLDGDDFAKIYAEKADE